jgi:MFS transporter, SP family, general alpha glucoside:H+ symporter
VVGQLLGPVGLQVLQYKDPYDYKTAVYSQFGMLGGLMIIYAILPETAWWSVSKDKIDKARKSLKFMYGGIQGYDIEEELAVMINTVHQERMVRGELRKVSQWEIFRGTNGWRLLIALWPKMMQQ